MKKFAYLALSGTALLLTLAACNKDEDPTPTPTPAPAPAPSKTDLLTAKTWKVTDIKAAGVSIYSLANACDLDDLYKFSTDKSATLDEGALRCDPTSPQSSKGSWEFTTNETKLKITDPTGDVEEGTIGTLTSTTFTLTETDPDGFGTGTPVTAEVTFTAQ